jgi:hypothetical protein
MQQHNQKPKIHRPKQINHWIMLVCFVTVVTMFFWQLGHLTATGFGFWWNSAGDITTFTPPDGCAG